MEDYIIRFWKDGKQRRTRITAQNEMNARVRFRLTFVLSDESIISIGKAAGIKKNQ